MIACIGVRFAAPWIISLFCDSDASLELHVIVALGRLRLSLGLYLHLLHLLLQLVQVLQLLLPPGHVRQDLLFGGNVGVEPLVGEGLLSGDSFARLEGDHRGEKVLERVYSEFTRLQVEAGHEFHVACARLTLGQVGRISSANEIEHDDCEGEDVSLVSKVAISLLVLDLRRPESGSSDPDLAASAMAARGGKL